MDIYFKDIAKTKQHLTHLQNEWEVKVKRRYDHLIANRGKYSFTNNYSYIVVSKYPEIISHYSELLILSIQEFEVWLAKYKHVTSYDDFYQMHWEVSRQTLTIEEIEMLQNDKFLFGRFDKSTDDGKV
jgi:phage anti-repressor protein